ncbi:unnamed protein product [Adineta ricciae]|uniref:Uncharacterized protein n=1 Tax=Adineta ricciae TaxID=249248 RepID=A0A814RW35_ADIRI|nr:unnamed protein product [Adineta ricciae]CAF1139364.1 unnamed protein product [Adineta ricciae]
MENVDIGSVLNILNNEEEIIIKPFQSASGNDVGAIECGRIVSRLNKTLFDYQIGDKTNTSVFSSVFTQRIILTIPGTKQAVLEFYQNCLPHFCQICCKQEVQCISSVSNESFAIGSVRQGYV